VREHGVPADHRARQRQHAQQPQGDLVFVGAGRHRQLPQHRRRGRDEGRQQVQAGGGAVAAAGEDLAVDGHGVGPVTVPGQQPAAQQGLEGVAVHGAEDLREGGLGEGLGAAEAQGMGEVATAVAAELGDGLQALAAGEHGDDGEQQQGSQGVDEAAWVAGVGDVSEHRDQGQRRHRSALRELGMKVRRKAHPIPRIQPTSTNERPWPTPQPPLDRPLSAGYSPRAPSEHAPFSAFPVRTRS
jgi:hypothetical protein